MSYDNMCDVAFKADWEGGYPELFLGYGFNETDVPPDAPEGFWRRVKALQDAWEALQGDLLDPWSDCEQDD